jgi:sulfofructosephosphate aldolase
MVALDQRESLRAMLAEARRGAVTAADIARFKVDATRALSPAASAVLLDRDIGLPAVLDADALAAGCALIVAADRLEQPVGGLVEDTTVDAAAFDDPLAADAAAYKLLVIWRPDRGEAERAAVVRDFLERCRARGRPGIVEGVVRRPAAPSASWDHAASVLACAVELGAYGPDLYKAEVPTLGAGSDAEIDAASASLTDALGCPWVVLSNGTPPERFDDAVVAACRAGASGFLAGRALWTSALRDPDPRDHLERVAAPRLRRLAERVDAVARPFSSP